MLKKLSLSLFVFVLLIAQNNVYSQAVGVGADLFAIDASAGFEVNYTNKGVLITRIALAGTTDTTTIVAPATSLLIYNTATVGDITPGFYYWNGNAWVKISTASDSFTCGNDYTYGGYDYKTIEIGSQCWFAENLRYNYKGCLTQEFFTDFDNERCAYVNNDSTNKGHYGILYQWGAAKNACPEGWRLPNVNDFKILFGEEDGIYGVGNVQWNTVDAWIGSDVGDVLQNALRFNALKAGYAQTNSDFYNENTYAQFWSSTRYGSSHHEPSYVTQDLVSSIYVDNLKVMVLNFGGPDVGNYGLSVRCLKE